MTVATTKLRNGDYCPDGKGSFETVSGAEEVLERALFQLTVKRGSFPLLPNLGSRLHLLTREKESARQSVGAGYAAEALAGEPDLQVTGAAWNPARQELTVYLTWQGQQLLAPISI